MSMFTCPYFKYIESVVDEDYLLNEDSFPGTTHKKIYPLGEFVIHSYSELKTYSSYLLHSLAALDYEEQLLNEYALKFNRKCSTPIFSTSPPKIDGDYLTNGSVVINAIKTFFDDKRWLNGATPKLQGFYDDTSDLFDKVVERHMTLQIMEEATLVEQVFTVLWDILLIIEAKARNTKNPDLNYIQFDSYDDAIIKYFRMMNSDQSDSDTDISNLIPLNDILPNGFISVKKARDLYKTEKNRVKSWVENDISLLSLISYNRCSTFPDKDKEKYNSDDGRTLKYEHNMKKTIRDEYFNNYSGMDKLVAQFIYTERVVNELYKKYSGQRKWIYQNYLYSLLELTYIRWAYDGKVKG